MAYQIKRTNHITDEVEMHDGDRTLTIKVDLTVDRILQKYNRSLQTIISTREQIDKLTDAGEIEAATVQLGAAIVTLFSLIFGEEQTRQILDFYGGNHVDMFADFLPYLTDVIMPKIQQAQQDVANRYKTTLRRFHK